MAISFEDLVNSISKLAVEAQDVMDEQSHARLEDLFDKNGDTLVPKTVKMKINGIEIDVPKIVVRNMNSLKIDTLTMELETEIDLNTAQTKGITASLKRGLRKNATQAKITVDFKSIEIPEGIELVRENLNTNLSDKIGESNG